jgi:iron-sulfur cluster protein
MTAKMRKRVNKALADRDLQTALPTFTLITKIARQIGMDGIDFAALRDEVRRVKEKSIADLPRLVEQFKAQAAKAGAVVYEARDARDATSYVLKLARERSVKRVVKSKSMVTEEIELNERLEHAGIAVRETDLGEYIVQLAGERPSHLTGPAIHKTVEQVAELFSRATGEKLPPDPPLLLRTAKNELRQTYINADMGISGANIAVAETGTLVLVTNEANGCLVTTLPPVHIAVVGCEKLVSTLDDALAILRLLSRSTTGQKQTVYVSYITGPSTTEAFTGAPLPGALGPGELHIVLVDNGRYQMRESEEFREALYCIKCGACLNVCPVFGSVAGQTYGYIYQGGIGAVLTAFLHGMDKAAEPASLCMGCRACAEVCPAHIDIPRMILRLREKLVAEKGLPLIERIAYRGILSHPGRLDRAVSIGSHLQSPFVGEGEMIRRLPHPLSSLTRTISLPAASRPSLRQRMKSLSSPRAGAHPTVAFYAGCIARYAYPGIGEAVVGYLRECGAEPYYPPGQACCGAPALDAGDEQSFARLAKINIAALEEMSPDYIVTVCPGCAVMLQQEYPRLFSGDPEWRERAEAVSARVRDFSRLVLELTPSAEKKPSRDIRVTYHDPCYLKRGLGVSGEPRKLLEREGFEILEMNDADACCGFAGQFVLHYPELAGAVLKRKLDSIAATGVEVVVTDCIPCVLQLRGGLDKRNSKTRVMHSAELLAGYGKPPPGGA